MHKQRRWRYYCDFCKRANGSGGHILKHERGCTMNPVRLCRMCALEGKRQATLPELLAALTISLDALQSQCDHCPACILAALRQSGADAYTYAWDYAAAAKTWWADHNAREQEQDQRDEYNAMVAEEMRYENRRPVER